MIALKRVGLLVTALIMAVALPALAVAADKGGPKRVFEDAPMAPLSWTGFYIGGNVGVVAGVMDPIFGVDGYQYGLQAGYDQQIGRLVLGVHVGYDWKTISAFSSSFDATTLSYGGSAGVLITDDAKLFAKISRLRLEVNGMGDSDGLGIGGGLQVKLTPNWSATAEYDRNTYDQLSNAREHVGMVRLNYHLPSNMFGGK